MLGRLTNITDIVAGYVDVLLADPDYKDKPYLVTAEVWVKHDKPDIHNIAKERIYIRLHELGVVAEFGAVDPILLQRTPNPPETCKVEIRQFVDERITDEPFSRSQWRPVHWAPVDGGVPNDK